MLAHYDDRNRSIELVSPLGNPLSSPWLFSNAPLKKDREITT